MTAAAASFAPLAQTQRHRIRKHERETMNTDQRRDFIAAYRAYKTAERKAAEAAARLDATIAQLVADGASRYAMAKATHDLPGEEITESGINARYRRYLRSRSA
ncbi:hypothetical protein [Arsenicicoccus dermatophilus]|uniref:hypothetical protein n=1 Tax=Arsenicicoccus dermatophilus TaxID=1076331 RepID=UPI003916D356